MKKYMCLIALILFLLAFSIAAFANDGFVIEEDVLIKYIGQEKNVVIPEGIISIGKSAFSDTDIVSVIIPDSVAAIAEHAFYNCRYLENVSLSYNLESIRTACFADCLSLKSLIIPTSVQFIGDGAFSNICALTIYIPDSVYSIGDFAFWGSEDNLTVVGEIGSAAERFTAKWDIEFIATNRTSEDFAHPSSTTFVIDENLVDFEAYMISGNNYIRLRDFAFAVQDTDHKFSVESSGKCFYLELGETYLPAGDEMSKGERVTKEPIYIIPAIFLNRQYVNMRTYKIDGEYFFKLRDIARLLEITVEWDELTETANLYCNLEGLQN